jgi:hypothetical protein
VLNPVLLAEQIATQLVEQLAEEEATRQQIAEALAALALDIAQLTLELDVSHLVADILKRARAKPPALPDGRLQTADGIWNNLFAKN